MSLHDLQTAVHVAKDKRNDFGGYNYRTAEGILAAAFNFSKPCSDAFPGLTEWSRLKLNSAE